MDHTEIYDKLQKEIHSIERKNKDIFSAVIRISNVGGDFNWSGAAGTAYANGSEAMTVETPIFIASITKMYTGAAAMILIERGQLSFKDPISKYLPASLINGLHCYKGQDYTSQLSIYHLISHTSGLPDYFMDKPKDGPSVYDRLITERDFGWGLEEVVDISRNKLTPKFPPQPNDLAESGKKAYYSDTNYQLLGAILQAVTQSSLQEVIEELITAPLELSSTYLYGSRDTQLITDGQPADVYYKTKALNLNKAMKSFGPDGGMVSTVDDSLKFLRYFLDGKLFNDRSASQRMKVWNKIFFPFQYGMALMRFKLPKIFSPFSPNPELIGHSGATSAFLFCSDIGQLYIAGSLNQIADQGRPYRYLIKLINLILKELT